MQVGGGEKPASRAITPAVVKINQRLSGGVTIQGSYAFSRIMTDADS